MGSVKTDASNYFRDGYGIDFEFADKLADIFVDFHKEFINTGIGPLNLIFRCLPTATEKGTAFLTPKDYVMDIVAQSNGETNGAILMNRLCKKAEESRDYINTNFEKLQNDWQDGLANNPPQRILDVLEKIVNGCTKVSHWKTSSFEENKMSKGRKFQETRKAKLV